MTAIEQDLFESLTKDFPAPWKLLYHAPASNRGSDRRYVSCIEAASGECPLTLETHSGDGDMFYLRDEGAEALVKFVNSIQAQKDA